jgi:apolipoprotein N-acyltransferase
MVPFQIATLISLALVSLTWLTAGMQKSSGVLRATAIVGVVLLAALGSYFAWTDFSMPTFTGPGSFLPRY